MPLRLLSPAHFAFFWTLFFSFAAHSVAAIYYVAPNGADTAAGTLTAPWRTLAKATATAVAGDTVFLRAGTYRETLKPAASGTATAPIAFSAYAGEAVTITGFDLLTPGAGGVGAWIQHSGNIWKIQLAATHGFGAGSTGRNQVAIDGVPMQEARWPNAAVYADVARTSLAITDAGTVDTASRDAQGNYACTYTDAALGGFAANAWAGGFIRMAVGKQWSPAVGAVTASTPTGLSFRYRYIGAGNDTPAKDDPYFLFGRLVALDAEGEFFLDDSARDGAAYMLYVYKPGGGSPATSTLEVRTRDLGLDLSGRSYINVTGLRFLSARVLTTSTTANCTLDRLAVDYAGHQLVILPNTGQGDSVTLSGTANILKNSTVGYATQFGLYFGSGSNACTAENNVIHHCGFSGISTGDARAPLVLRNTIHDTGSFCIAYNSRGGRFLYNHVYYGGTHCVDIGLINAFVIGDAEVAEIGYNWVHDNLAPFDLPGHGWNGGCGIRADCGFGPFASLNVLVHHNVVWNTTHPGSIVFWGVTDAQWAATPRTYAQGSTTIDTRNYAYHNTLSRNIEYGAGRTGGVPIFASGGRLKNNLLAGTFNPSGVNTTNVEATYNLFASAVSGFANNTVAATTFVSPFDSAFKVPAAAIDAGTIVAPYSDGYRGALPDLGAYESGGEFWLPGATVLPEHIAALTATYVATSGRIALGGFPLGRLLPTGAKLKVASATSTAIFPAHDLASRALSAAFAIDLTGIGGVQTVALSLDGTAFTPLAAPLTLPGAQTGGTTPPTVTSAPGRLINLSVLTTLGAAGDSFSLGYVVSGASATNPKPLVIRAAGPSLAALGVSATHADPKLELFAGSAKSGENDDWGGAPAVANAMAGVGAFAYMGATSRDAAVAANITSRDNSVRISAGATSPGATGAVIAEVYDATPAASFDSATTPRLINFSVLKNVGTSLTMGFVLGGGSSRTVLVRAVGPTLASLGVAGAMADPKIELFDAAGRSLATNDNWGGAAALAAAFAQTGAFTLAANARDAALLATLAPGNYTVQVTVATGATGAALVEVYEVP